MSGQYQTRVQRSGIHRSWSAIFEGQNQRRRWTPASASTPKITRPGALEQPPSEASSGASGDRKSTRLNSSHANISYAVFCLKKKKKNNDYLILKKKKKQ